MYIHTNVYIFTYVYIQINIYVHTGLNMVPSDATSNTEKIIKDIVTIKIFSNISNSLFIIDVDGNKKRPKIAEIRNVIDMKI
jgi:hypothetical protein